MMSRVSADSCFLLRKLGNENHFKLAGLIFTLKKPLYVAVSLNARLLALKSTNSGASPCFNPDQLFRHMI